MNLKSINKLSVGRELRGWRSLSRGATLFWEHNRTKGDGEHLIHFFTYVTLMGVSGSGVSSESPWNKGANAKYMSRMPPSPMSLWKYLLSTAAAPLLLRLSQNCPLQLCFLSYRRGTIVQSGTRGSPGDVGGCRSDDARARRHRRRSFVPGMLIMWETPVGHT